jgi:hypothetical protein
MAVAPPVHAHRAGIEGRRTAVVHAHPQVSARRVNHDGPSNAAALSSDHGDHVRAIFLDAASEPASGGWLPATGPTAGWLLQEPRAVRSVGLDVLPRAHAPPLRAWVPRGPPALS